MAARLAIFILISSFISLCYAQDLKNLPSADFSSMHRAQPSEVVDVVSPLTVLLRNGTIVQLSGIDIPNSYGEEISPLAVSARDILKDMLSSQKVSIYQSQDKELGRINRMGHVLAHLARKDDGAWAQGTLLALGLARVKTTHATSGMLNDMLELEKIARNANRGIWADQSYRVFSPDMAEDVIGEFAIIEGRIHSVALKKNRIYINFGKNWRDDFTVSIAPEDKRAFSKAKLDPLGWGGKIIRVRGSIRSYNGPYMEINHPAAIEFID